MCCVTKTITKQKTDGVVLMSKIEKNILRYIQNGWFYSL